MAGDEAVWELEYRVINAIIIDVIAEPQPGTAKDRSSMSLVTRQSINHNIRFHNTFNGSVML